MTIPQECRRPQRLRLQGVREQLGDACAIITAPSSLAGVASTIVDTTTSPFRLLRRGAVTDTQLLTDA